MSDSSADFTEDELRCPTCGAAQPWSNVCRRCKSDLELVVATLQQMQRLHVECLASLASGDTSSALSFARRRWELSPDEISARLLGVCYATLGRFDVVRQLLALDVED